VVGMDTRFGYRNSGDVSTLADLGEQFGFEVVALDDVGEGERFSSTVVRAHLRAGEVGEAARILGRPHRVVGTVVHGNHRGKALGYPTANLSADSLGLVPMEGVYAGWLTRMDLPVDASDRTMPAAISVGTNPTFETHDRRTVEAYVLDRDDLDLYDERVMVEFTAHIRPTLKFESVDELLEAMGKDVARCRELLTKIVPA
jgi:riboflavin kinase / FMN adenylyltransferase